MTKAVTPSGPRAWLDAIQPWAVKYRIALFSVGAFFMLSIFLGVLLGNLRHAPAAPAAQAAASADAAVSGEPGVTAPAAAKDKVKVSFDIRPWGEVFIDGKPTGVAPPLSDMDLAIGHHHIEIRHEPAPPWQADIDVHGTAPITIEHAFP